MKKATEVDAATDRSRDAACALLIAVRRRQPRQAVIVHSDHASQNRRRYAMTYRSCSRVSIAVSVRPTHLDRRASVSAGA
jgi:transposase InsO family protein